tara:strand:+ start:4053 stop:5219 length:1167 start_codon:yes stop_codon:yes gene_type:complete
MNLANILKKNILYPYIIFGSLIFIILFSINFFYNKHVLNLTRGFKYDVSAIQFNNYKYNSYGEVFAYVFDKKIKTLHRIKGQNVESAGIFINGDSPGLTLKKTKTTLYLTLILNDYVDEKELENAINETYMGSVRKVISELEENSHLYDYRRMSASYGKSIEKEISEDKKTRDLKIKEAHDNLINSEFFKKYPTPSCTKKKEYCLNMYNEFYVFIMSLLQNSDDTRIKKFLDIKENENISISEVYREFIINKSLYQNKYVEDLMNNKTLGYKIKRDSISRNNKLSEYQFFSKEFDKLINSKFYNDYNFDSYCRTYDENCLNDISDDFNRILHQHKLEIGNPYRVKYSNPNEKRKYSIISDVFKILGFTMLFTYILFILTNKFLRRKLK